LASLWYGSLVNYHPDDFISLIVEVEEQDGLRLGEECRPRSLRFENQPPDLNDFDDKTPRVTKIVGSTGCKRQARFMVPLLSDEIVERILPTDTKVADTTDVVGELNHRDIEFEDFDFNDMEHPNALTTGGKPVPVTACAVDDAMGLWPRFNSAMHTGESFMVD
jgi:hypothetical protein